MKKWPVVLLVVAALVVLVSPGIVGRLAEDAIEEGIAFSTADNDGVQITTESFDRGWFTSAGRHRVEFSGTSFEVFAGQYRAATGGDELPALLIDTRVDHGLVPVTSIGREEGSLMPGLANTVSTLSIDPGDGTMIEIPGELYSQVGVSGSSFSRLRLRAGSFMRGDATLSWDDADFDIALDPGAATREVAGSTGALYLDAGNTNLGLDAVSVDAQQSLTRYGFNVGNAHIVLHNLAVTDALTELSASRLSIDADSRIDGDTVSGESSFLLEALTVAAGETMDAELRLSVAGIDADSLGVINSALQNAQQSDNVQAAVVEVFDDIIDDLENIAARGGMFSIDQLEISWPQGLLSTNLTVDVAENDSGDDFSWPGALLRTSAAMNLRMPVELFETALSMYPEAGSLVAMGILKREGEEYVMAAEMEKGLISVNGFPMPVPIPGMN